VNHADIGKHLADYLEGELPIEERALVDAHLDGCHVCAGEVEEMLRTIRLLRTLPEPEPPPMIAANVMRRVRSGESQLGLFQRIGRALGAVFEPGFVLPASAIAVAALVVTVVQGLGVLPTSNFVGEGRDASIDQSASSAALLPSTMPSVLAPRHGYGESDALDIVARVERRATQSDPRLLRAYEGQRVVVGLGGATRGSGPRIRINLNGLVLAQQPMAQPPLTSGGPILSPRIPGAWVAGDGSGTWGVRSKEASPGMLIMAERFGSSNMMADMMADPGVWPRASSPGGTDPRDAWLALGFEDPAEFARYIAAQNLAEQELWAARLSERAEGRGLLDEFLETLRESGDPTAVWVADDFAAQVDRMSSGFSDLKAQVAP
jgi:hypothetical protein